MTLHGSRSLPALVAAALWLGGAILTVPAAETGRLLSRVFLPEDYRGEVQVSDIVQTSDGLIYAANLGAVKEFDGRAWRTIPVPTSWIMDLDAGNDGRVYIAGVDEIGFLELGADGRRVFRSILDRIPAEMKPLGQLWTTWFFDGAGYWSNDRHVLRWRAGELRTWSFPTEGRRVLYHGGKHLYLASTADGLSRLDGETWTAVSTDPQCLRLPSAVLDDWASPGIAVLERDGHWFRLDPAGAAVEVPGELPAVIASVDGARLSDSILLRDGRLAITTKNAGIFVINRQGGIDLRFGTEGGLSVPNLYSACEDQEGGLWVGAAYGCVRVELDPSLTVFDQKNGAPPGNMYTLARFEGGLYSCGSDGLYRFAPGSAGAQGRFERVPAERGFIPYDLLAHSSGLLIAADVGLFRFSAGAITLEFRGSHSFTTVANSVSDPDRIFVGGVDFIYTLRWDGVAWRDEGVIAAAKEDARSMVEDRNGVLWVGTPTHGVARVRRLPGRTDWQSAQVELFDDQRGLPAGHDWVTACDTPVGPLFTHAKGVSAYDPASDRLVPAAAFAAAGVGGRYTYPLTGGRGASMWLQFGYPAAGDTPVVGGLRSTPGGGWEWKELSAGVFSALGFLGAGEMIWEPGDGGEGVLWILGQQNIVRWELDGALRDRAAAPPAVVLRGIGRGPHDLSLRPEEAPRLAFARDPLRVQFASPVYALKGTVEYQYRLLGYDERWAAWSPHNEAIFTNLMGGSFAFEVRARRGGGDAGPVTTWKFSVRPPWWRSVPAIAGYAAIAVGLMWLLLRWRMAALERDRARLEREVRQRTEELAHERDRAEAANRAKTMFLASMSHELRTPLHAILGYSQLLGGDQSLPDGARGRLQIVANSGQHLLRLINEVLDLSKIEAGKLELRAEPFDLPGLLGEIVQAQEARATARKLVFQRPDLAGLPAMVVGDAQKLRQILDNLLGNAVKFTSRGEVRLGVLPVAAGRLHFEVSDTGPGIAAEDVQKLFQPFTQAGAGAETPERGSGLGLTIAQRLVGLMGGELQVASTVGEGSRFWFEIVLAGAAGARAGERRPARRLIGYDGPRRRVLAVDDVEANRLLFRDLLAPLGFDIALAGSADEALALLDRVRPDLVLLDLRMPGTNGFALARILRSDPRLEGVKILAASASVFGHDPGEALAAGCDGFISKPFLPEDFFARVAQLLALTWREAGTAAVPTEEPLTPALLEALQAAARLGDVVALREAFDQLQARHPRAAGLAEIEQAIDAFDTDRVGQLAAQHLRPARQS